MATTISGPNGTRVRRDDVVSIFVIGINLASAWWDVDHQAFWLLPWVNVFLAGGIAGAWSMQIIWRR